MERRSLRREKRLKKGDIGYGRHHRGAVLFNQRELARLIPVLERTGANTAVRQAAVWIVTDDANYADLGTLVSRPVFALHGGTRVIEENDAAMAMKICSEAGIDITRKSIWSDRHRILEGLQDDELKVWLGARVRQQG